MATPEAVALQQVVASDVRFLAGMFVGFVQVLFLQACLGFMVYTINKQLPGPAWRLARLATGGAVFAVTRDVGLRIFDPDVSFTGTCGAATLLLFNTPLRVVQLLLSPITSPLPIGPVPVGANEAVPASAGKDDAAEVVDARPRAPPRTISPARLTALLTMCPACPILPALSALPTGPKSPPAVSAAWSYGFANLLFCGGALILYATPREYVSMTVVLSVILTVMASGFAHSTAGLFGMISGVPISAPFTYPWSSPSFASFWAWRWNAPIAHALRHGVFDPLVVFAGAPPAIATLACFAASGVAHGLILFNAEFSKAHSLMWVAFFMVHGVFVCIERYLLVRHGEMLAKHAWPRRLVTIAMFVLTVEYLFFTPFKGHAKFDQIADELATSVRLAVNTFRLLGQGESLLPPEFSLL